jgi:DinB superfamily
VHIPSLSGTASVKGSASSLQIGSLLEQIQSITRKAEKLVQGRSNEDLVWKSDPGAWSVAECLDHLAQTTEVFLAPISEAVASAPILTNDRSLRTGTLARLFIRNLEPPYRLRFKVLPQLTPCRHDFRSAWTSFLTAQSSLQELVRSATGLAIDRVKIKSPVYARIAYNIYGSLCMLAAHERRHLWQIEQILAAIDATRSQRKPL